MKYLFAAIDARQQRVGTTPPTARTLHRLPRPRYNSIELKKLVVEASEGVDDKSSANDFVDTLERIVNEIKNTTEHSGAFLQKVRKTDVPDYYDVIKRPMDLATLQKRVKQQMYRTKKAFSDDLELIWSNCLLYNSHPSHPLRRSAEILRQKSNQLLEFITDPALPTRSIYAASLPPSGPPGSNRGTPALADDEADADGEAEADSDEEEMVVSKRRDRKASAIPSGLLNGDGHFATDSPTGSRSATPAVERPHQGRHSRGPAFRRSLTPETPLLPFEETPAIVRTAHAMSDFADLDSALSVADTAFDPVASTYLSPLDVAPAIITLARSLHPRPAPQPPSTTTDTTTDGTPVDSPGPRPAAPLPPPPEPVVTAVDDLWWSTLSATDPPPLVTTEPDALAPALVGLASGLPVCGWIGSSSTREALTGSRSWGKPPKPFVAGGTRGSGLGAKMKRNAETLRRIKRLQAQLTATATSDLDTPQTCTTLINAPIDATLLESDASDVEDRPRRSEHSRIPLTKGAFRDVTLAPVAARSALESVSHRVLGHAGFDGTSSTALGVLAHVTAEYMTNLGRTLRFYSERYGDRMSSEQILLHALGENGVPAPRVLDEYVREDIDAYGLQLEELRLKLDQARRDQLDDHALAGSSIGNQDQSCVQVDSFEWDRDGEALLLGQVPHDQDMFNLTSLGLDKDLGSGRLAVPARLFRGGEKPTSQDSAESTASPSFVYAPPPSHPPLHLAAVPTMIGLLQPYYALRATQLSPMSVESPLDPLIDDHTLYCASGRSTGYAVGRSKVPGTSGRIPVKHKKRNGIAGDEDAPLLGTKKRRKKKADGAIAVEGA